MADGKVTISTTLDNKGLEKGIKSVSGVFGGLAKTVAKTTIAITAAFATAAAAITKQAVEAYADYEQLTGGVETLFKSSADKVKKYAEDAFYTVGISANEYMATVTSFSASLISSLGGDTDKAADVANMALIDMADNANKMGSSLESVQTAYQGFAKQQYQLLDNLKLGYGGTKTEMERLLKDAEAFSGVKYDINNLGDVYEAIHQIQIKLDIAGTTAKEAEKTITGSANMTKAAWKNTLAAIAGGGDLDKAINNLVYSVSKYFDNIVPVVERSLAGIGQLIEKIAPQLVQTVATALIKAIPSLLNAVYQMIIGLAKGIVKGIEALFSGGHVTETISAQLSDVVASAAGAADAEKELAEGIEEAGKAAKKSTAGFDELNILQSSIGSSESETAASAARSTSSTVAESATTSVSNIVDNAMQPLITKIKELIEPLQKINLSSAIKSFKKLGTSIQKLGKVIGSSLEWFWFNILVPLADFVIEDALPVFFDGLATAVDFLGTILDKSMGLLKQLVDEFLQPIAEYTGEKTLDFFGDLNAKLSDLNTMLQNSSVWSDFATILGEIYEALEPVVTYLIDLAFWLGDLVLDEAWSDAKFIFSELEDAIGAVASLIQGDFDDAWEHLKNLLWENNIDSTKEKVDNLKESIDSLKTIVSEYTEKWKESLKNIVDEWSGKIAAWWQDDVEPWFTIKKWENVIQGMVDGFANSWNKVYDFFTESVPKWWNDNIAPWFTKEKWEGIIEDAVEGVKSGWNSFTKFFTETLPDWWDEDVAPWFTAEKWKELGENAIKGLANPIIDGINSIIEGLNSFSIDIPKIKGLTDGFTWGFNIPKIPKLAQGAVLPANKPFMAVVGDQKYGTNIEAPLETIKQALAEVLAVQNSGDVTINFTGDLAQLGRVLKPVIDKENRRVGGSLVRRTI